MKKILIILLFILYYNTGYSAVYNQDNRIDIKNLVKNVYEFEKQIEKASSILERKKMLLELSIYKNSSRTQDMVDNEISFLFHMIHSRIGTENFQLGLKKIELLKDQANPNWLQILNCFAGLDADNFYETYFNNKSLINLTVKDAKFTVDSGIPIIEFRLIRTKGTESLKIPYLLDYGTFKETGILKSGINQEDTFKVPVKSDNVSMVLDPYYALYRELSEREKSPVIADMLNSKDILYISDNDDYDVRTVFKGIKDYRTHSDVTFKDIKNRDIIISGYNSDIASFFTDKKAQDGRSEYFIFKNPQGADNYILIMNNPKPINLEKLKDMALNQELIFKDDKVVTKNISSSDFGIYVYENKSASGVKTSPVLTISDIIKNNSSSKVFFVGEEHTNYAHHLNQLEAIKALHINSKKGIAIGLEMIQSQYQNVLDDFIQNKISEKEMLEKTEYFSRWGFDYNLYAPIFRYARENKIDLIGLNIPRSITSKIFSGEIDSLTSDEKMQLPKGMNVINDKYKSHLKNVFSMHKSSKNQFDNFFLAQNIWDETMAYNLVSYINKNPEKRIVVVAGGGHSDKSSGIPLRYKRLTGDTPIVILQDEDIDNKRADYILFTKEIKGVKTPSIGVILSTDEKDKDIVKIKSVEKSSPADISGLKAGDIIIRCGYHNINNAGSLKYALFEKGLNNVIECSIKRGNTTIKKNIKLIEYEVKNNADDVKKHIEKMKSKKEQNKDK